MITELHLTNFRGFEDHVVPLKPFTIVVGRNNAGKSTIAEALRLISLVVSRFKGNLADIPARWEFPRNRRGPHPFKNLEINLQSVFHRYGEPPAFVRAKFSAGEIVEVTITRDEIIARRTRSRLPRGAKSPGLSRVSLLPQVAPVARKERLLTEEYVRGALSSALAPLHFRNQNENPRPPRAVCDLQDAEQCRFAGAALPVHAGVRGRLVYEKASARLNYLHECDGPHHG